MRVISYQKAVPNDRIIEWATLKTNHINITTTTTTTIITYAFDAITTVARCEPCHTAITIGGVMFDNTIGHSRTIGPIVPNSWHTIVETHYSVQCVCLATKHNKAALIWCWWWWCWWLIRRVRGHWSSLPLSDKANFQSVSICPSPPGATFSFNTVWCT